MDPMMRRRILVGAFVLCCTALAAAAQDLTQKEADSMGNKLLAVLERGTQQHPRTGKPLRTSFTERELNAYLKYYGETPPGLVNPRIMIVEAGRLEARAVVDLDAIRKSKERGWLDPLGYVTGSMEVRAIGMLKTANGRGTLELLSATLGGVPLPKTLLQELVAHYTRTPEMPAGFNLDQPFDLPHNIRQVEIQRGAATIVQ
jgi:hypothetical protein